MAPHHAPSNGARYATTVGLAAGAIAFAVTLAVNGLDFVRATISGLLWIAIGWYASKS